jgi:hypothetical protein
MSGYNKRSRVEAAIGRYKQVIGDGLHSRKDQRRTTEVGVSVHVPNRMLELGRPDSARVGLTQMGLGVSRPTLDPCNNAADGPRQARFLDASSCQSTTGYASSPMKISSEFDVTAKRTKFAEGQF